MHFAPGLIRKLQPDHQPAATGGVEKNMNTAKIPDEVELIRVADVLRITGLSRSTLYEKMLAKEFPSQISLGPRAVAWVKSEVLAWAQARISAARPG